MRGRGVVAKVTYCGHTIRAEAELDDRGQWIGGGVVVGRDCEGALPLTTPRPTPGAALDATLMAGGLESGEGVMSSSVSSPGSLSEEDRRGAGEGVDHG